MINHKNIPYIFNKNKICTILQYVNRSFCNRTGIYLAGCGAHRLHLVVYDFLGPEEKKRSDGQVVREASEEQAVISKHNALMGELKTIKNAAILRSCLT